MARTLSPYHHMTENRERVRVQSMYQEGSFKRLFSVLGSTT